MGDGGPAMPVFGLVLIAAIATSGGLIVVLRPLLVRYALARPNARSSHREPTPQGGGIAVVAAALTSLWIGVVVSGLAAGTQLAALTLAALALALVGVVDDIRGLGAVPRLVLQALDRRRRARDTAAKWRDTPAARVSSWRCSSAASGSSIVNFMDGID